MQYLRLIVVGSLIGLGASAFAKVSLANPTICSAPYRHDLVVHAGNNLIETEVAKTYEQKATGLSGRSCIGADQGMLFTFDKPGYYPFWMKDMKFPIDIVWVSENKTVNKIVLALEPSTYPQTFVNTKPAEYVLELQAGASQRLNITEGTTLDF
jgi:uncharacterized membrane protein (UPF0127 family)